MVEIRWLTKARDDLKNIYDYISLNSERYAERQVQKIYEQTQVLRDHIKVGRVVEEINDPEIREISLLLVCAEEAICKAFAMRLPKLP